MLEIPYFDSSIEWNSKLVQKKLDNEGYCLIGYNIARDSIFIRTNGNLYEYLFNDITFKDTMKYAIETPLGVRAVPIELAKEIIEKANKIN